MLSTALGQKSQSITQSYQCKPSNEAKSSVVVLETKMILRYLVIP